MPRFPKYGYARDMFGRVQERDSFKDGAYSNEDYGQAGYDPEDDNGDTLSFDTFTFNEDGTLHFVAPPPPSIPAMKQGNYGEFVMPGPCTKQCKVSKSSSTQNKSRVTKTKKSPKIIYDSETKVQYIIQSFRNCNTLVSNADISRYIPQIAVHLRDYFYEEVKKINALFLAQQKEQELAEAKANMIEMRERRVLMKRTKKEKPKLSKKSQPKQSKSLAAQIYAELKEIERQKNELVNTLIKSIQETGDTATFGNFKISKLK